MLISANLAVVEPMATWVGVMYLGCIVEEGETDRIIRSYFLWGEGVKQYTRKVK